MTNLSRRAVLGGSAIGLGIASLTQEVQATSAPGPLPGKVDVVVVGAGISGLMSARRIAAHGRSVLVVEARNRVGGRVLNHRLPGGATIESGGAFIGPTQDHIAALADDLGVATFPEYNTGNSVYLSRVLGRLTYQGTVPPDPLILPDAALLQTTLDNMAAELDVNAPWTHPKAAQWDAITLGHYIRTHSINSSGIENLIRCWTQPGFGADPAQLSLLYVLWYIACSGNEKNKGSFERNSNTAGGAQERRFVGGSQLIPLRMARALGRRVALNAPVRRVDRSARGVVVHTPRGRVHCQRLIVAVPPSTLRRIDFRPGLPRRHRALLEDLRMGQLMKCDAVYETPFWREDGLNGFGISDHGAVRVAFDNSPANGNPGVLLAFVGGSTWRQYGVQTLAARRAAVLEGFAEMFGERALHPIGYVEHDWTREHWTGGGPVANYGVGVMTAYGSAVRRPAGRIHWAGTETSTYWTGYMDGAVRSGKRAAAEVLHHLG